MTVDSHSCAGGNLIPNIIEICYNPPEKLSRLYQELAIRLYQKELLSFGKARELAQMTKWEFHELLGRENIIRHYDIAELEVDLKTLEQLT